VASSPRDAGSPGTTTRAGSGGATVPVGAASSGAAGPGGRAGATAGSGGVVTPYELVVNGVARRVDGARASDSLLHVLRDRLGLPGAKNACEQGECGSCSVLVDGVLVCACLELAEAVTGCAVTTVEGLEPAGGEPSDAALGGDVLTDVQRAMVEAGGVQCGFCTPGFVVAIHDLLARVPEPGPFEVREALAGNLCRCTGYGRILAAVEQVVAVRSSVGGETASGGPAPWQAAGSEPRGSA
jgi:carbon-monoxide dehydrogenase small subunit